MPDIKYSVWSNYFFELEPEAKIDAFLDCGFTSSEFSDEDGAILLGRGNGEKEGLKLKKYADDRGFSFPQGHLLLSVDLTSDSCADTLKGWLDMFMALGIRAGVLHAQGGDRIYDFDECFERKLKNISILADYLKGTDFVICLENLRGEKRPQTVSELNRYIDPIGDANLGICLDTGHLNICHDMGERYQSQGDFIRSAGKRLKALHIADNDTSGDQHLMPYSKGNVNWTEVMEALEEIGYDGLFNMEIPGESHVPMAVKKAKCRYCAELCRIMLGLDK